MLFFLLSNIRVALILVATMLATSGFAYAGDFEAGKQAAQSGDYATAETFFRKAMEDGHPGALNGLGIIYRNGLNGKQSFPMAYNFFKQAASQG